VTERPTGLHTSSPAELKARLEAARRAVPFLAWRDPDGEQQLFSLERERVCLGRGSLVDIDLVGDGRVSRLHATLEEVGGCWVLCDEGLSRHGSRVNGEKIAGRRRLDHGDVLTLGETSLVFLAGQADAETGTASDAAPAPPLTPADRSLLDVLCDPVLQDSYAAPASNRDIAAALGVSEARVKARLGALFVRFQLDSLPQNQKRAALAAQALRLGVVRPLSRAG
jgi:Inner membrane component of T3SS, cytoplasmic domain